MLTIQTGNTNTILRNVSQPIHLDEIQKYRKLGKQMVKYIKNTDNGGCGLAAPQIGYNIRLIVVSLLKDWDDKNYSTIMMINPKIVEHSEEKNIDIEGCLSVPGEKGKVARWNMIKLEYRDEKGQKKSMIYDDLRSRIIQHEIDHLDGILFTDKLT